MQVTARYGYNIARMSFEIVFSPEADEDRRRLKARDWSIVRHALEIHLRHEPRKESKSRIKRLRGLTRPQYRLRVGEVRVFYDVTEQVVEVLAVVPRSMAGTWLEEEGKPQ